MKPFKYATALSVERAVELVADNGRYFGGGIDLLGEIKDEIALPDIVVNIKELPGTRDIRKSGDTWTIGSNVTLTELAEDPDVRTRLPGLARAAEEVGSPQIRNVATMGGNLAQHSRCWYYRHHDIQCLKKNGATCFAREGNNRHHSIFSGNPCISPVVSNLAIALAALDAKVNVHRGGEVRPMTIAQLYDMAWFNPMAHNSLTPQDLIVSVSIPMQANRSAYMQLSEKAAFDWALVSCSAAARVENGRLAGPRVVLGVVAPVPYQKDAVNRMLNGQILTAELAERAAEAMLEGAEPFEDNAYKVPMAKALIKRTLMQLVA